MSGVGGEMGEADELLNVIREGQLDFNRMRSEINRQSSRKESSKSALEQKYGVVMESEKSGRARPANEIARHDIVCWPAWQLNARSMRWRTMARRSLW
eukprot:IDg14596t1